MKYRHSILLAALSAAAIYALNSTAQAETTYLNPGEYTDNVKDGDYVDLWAYEDYLENGMLKRSGLQLTTSKIENGSTVVIVAGGDHTVGASGEKGDIAGGKRGQSVTSTNLTINGGTNIERVIGGNYSLGYVEGNRNIVINGGTINYVYGGDWYVEKDRAVTPDGQPNKYVNAYYDKDSYGVQSSTEVWTPKKSAGDINITVTGGTVGQIRGGHNCATGVITGDIGMYEDENGNVTEHRPYSVGGNVNIVLEQNAVVGTGSGDAIRGAGGSYCSVDGIVNITIKDNATVKGNIYAGARNTYGQIGGSCIKIEGGEVTGNVYGGGSFDTTGTTTLHDTEIILSGGKVNGNIYAAGDGDTVKGNTTVTVLGNGTEQRAGDIISGGGINNATVEGTKTLELGNSDLAAKCSLNIRDFDEVIISSGSDATLNSVTRAASTLDNVTLLATTNDTENTFTLNLNGIHTNKLTLAIQLADNITELSDFSISLISNSLVTSDLLTEVIFLDMQGNEISGSSDVQLSGAAFTGGTTFSISASIPEPTTVTLSILALAALAARKRRR